MVLRRQTWRQEPGDGGAGHLSRGALRLQRQAFPGERGVVLLLAPDMKQAKVLLDYAEGRWNRPPS